MIAKKIKQYISELHPDKNVKRMRGRFQEILKSTSSAAWGWVEPISHEGQKIVYLIFSPEKKGDKQSLFYDFITNEEYSKDN